MMYKGEKSEPGCFVRIHKNAFSVLFSGTLPTSPILTIYKLEKLHIEITTEILNYSPQCLIGTWLSYEVYSSVTECP